MAHGVNRADERRVPNRSKSTKHGRIADAAENGAQKPKFLRILAELKRSDQQTKGDVEVKSHVHLLAHFILFSLTAYTAIWWWSMLYTKCVSEYIQFDVGKKKYCQNRLEIKEITCLTQLPISCHIKLEYGQLNSTTEFDRS